MAHPRSITTGVGVITAIVVLGSTPARSQDATQLGQTLPQSSEVKIVEGKIVDLGRPRTEMTVVMLDNGTRLAVPAESAGPGEQAKVGDTVVARYVDNGRDKVATLLKVIETQAP